MDHAQRAHHTEEVVLVEVEEVAHQVASEEVVHQIGVETETQTEALRAIESTYQSL